MTSIIKTQVWCDGLRGVPCPRRSVVFIDTVSTRHARNEAVKQGWSYARITNGKSNIHYEDVCPVCTRRRSEDVSGGNAASADAN